MAEVQLPEAAPQIPDVQDEVPPAPIPPAEQPAQHQEPAEPEAAQGELEISFSNKLKGDLKRLQEAMDALTNASVENLLKKMLDYGSRPLSEFNKFEALAMVDTLQNTAHDTKHEKENYYRLAYQTVRAKVDIPTDQFRSLLLRLLGDKEHEKVFDIVTKVEKSYQRAGSRERPSMAQTYIPRGRWPRPPNARCFYCQQSGHFRAQCLKRKRDLGDVGEKQGNSKGQGK